VSNPVLTGEENPSGMAANTDQPELPIPPGMVWIPGGKFLMGCEADNARPDESPTHVVKVSGFYMDITEVTNAQFAEFVAATGYITTAEKPPQLEEIMKQQPPGTPLPDPGMLVPGAMVFFRTEQPVDPNEPNAWAQWWRYVPGADWRHPQGPESNIDDLADHPVVQVSWDDAVAYCKWAGKQLPSEAQWEFAARGGLHQQPYVWGAEPVSDEKPQANIWQGQFPYRNAATDGFVTTAPVKSFPPNNYGLYDMAGNVWEWCSDWYRKDYYETLADSESVDPTGPESTDHPYEPRRAQRGGSFLCHRDYCSSYRPSARMSTSADTGLCHAGFRPVMSKAAWEERFRAGAGSEKNQE
jgi:formylglycine-generating enzyme required for sulfatase activity